MASVLNGLTKLFYLARIDDLNHEIGVWSNRKLIMMRNTQYYTDQKSQIIKRIYSQMLGNSGEIDYSEIQARILAETADIDVQLQLNSMKENDIDTHMKLLETERNGYQTNYDEIEKLEASNIKKEYNVFGKQ